MSLKPRTINFEQSWKELQSIVEVLLSHREAITRRDYQEAFMMVYTLCTATSPDVPYFEQTYYATRDLLETHVQTVMAAIQSGIDQLALYQEHWDKYYRGSTYINSMYGYMNKQHIAANKSPGTNDRFGIDSVVVSQQKPTKDMGEMALDIWKSPLLKHVSNEIVRAIMSKIKQERQGDIQKESVIRDVIQSYIQVDSYLPEKYQLSTYKDHIEKQYLEDAEVYYREEAEMLKLKHSCSEYMICVRNRINSEMLRCQKYLHRSSADQVALCCSTQMVKQYLPFLHGELADILKQERWNDLRNMWSLCKNEKLAIEPINEHFHKFVKEKGVEVVRILFESSRGRDVNDTTLSKNFVEKVLQVHGEYTKIIREFLDSDQMFFSSLDKAFMMIVNYKEEPTKSSKSSELLAKYCDFLLKKNRASESEVDEKLAMAVTVLKYIEEPDIFQKHYQKQLGKRLISNSSVSLDSEESMIKQLKGPCGYDFINKLNRMFTDIGISTGLNQDFSDYLDTNQKKMNFGHSIHVLSAGFWPLNSAPAVSVRIPDEIQRFVTLFKEFYDCKFSGRRLLWLHHMSTSEVIMRTTRKNYIIKMTIYHLALLNLFNTNSTVTCSQISESTDISHETVVRLVESMTNHVKILEVCSPSESLRPESVIKVNENFTNKLVKFQINIQFQREVEREVQQTRSSVEEDRRMFLQAAIVRIMKSRKTLRHTALVEEVLKQSVGRFQPNLTHIKRAIEGLIEKSYLERNANNADQYEYVA